MRSTLLLLLAAQLCTAQTFLNGSFEINTAGSTDQINTSNSTFNSMMSDVFSFGTNANLDIIKSSTWGGSGAQHCTWYVALTEGGTDALTLKLSSPLTSGVTYTMSFWDRKATHWIDNPVQIGLSTVNNAIGTIIYTSPNSPVNNVWTQRTFTFVAPNNGDYVSVIHSGTPNTSNWLHVDNFALNNSGSGLSISTTADSICAGNSVTLAVTGGSGYQWSPSGSLNSATSPTVTATPPITTTYTLSALVDGCNMNSNITIKVLPQVTVAVSPSSTMICEGHSVTLNGSGASSYSWIPTLWLNMITGSVVVATPSISVVYTVTGSNGVCANSSTAAVTLTQASQPSVTGAIICLGKSGTITAAGAASYTWVPVNIASSVAAVSPTATTVYTVITEDQMGCQSQAQATVQVLPLPSLSVAVSATNMCRGDKRVMSASGASTYTWMPGSVASGTLPVTASTVGNFTYAVTGVHSNGCAASKAVTVSVKICEGIEEPGAVEIGIYPNPSRGAFTITSDRETEVRIYCVTGALIRQLTFTGGERQRTVEGLTPGVYLILDDKGRLLKKAVVLD